MNVSILSAQEVSRAQFGPRELKDPRSREYAIQTLYALKSYAESLKCDQDRIERELAEIDRYRHWEVLGYESKEVMLKAELTDIGISNVQLAAKAREQKDIKQGQRTDLEHSSNATKFDSQKRDQSYTLRRLARERPDLLDAFERGELSAHAAAIAAGFRRRTFQVPEGDAERAAALIARHYTREALMNAWPP